MLDEHDNSTVVIGYTWVENPFVNSLYFRLWSRGSSRTFAWRSLLRYSCSFPVQAHGLVASLDAQHRPELAARLAQYWQPGEWATWEGNAATLPGNAAALPLREGVVIATLHVVLYLQKEARWGDIANSFFSFIFCLFEINSYASWFKPCPELITKMFGFCMMTLYPRTVWYWESFNRSKSGLSYGSSVT